MVRISILALGLVITALVFKSKIETSWQNEVKAYKLPTFSVSIKKKSESKSESQNSPKPELRVRLDARRSAQDLPVQNMHPQAIAKAKALKSTTQKFLPKTPTETELSRQKKRVEEEKVMRAWENVRAKAYAQLGMDADTLTEISRERRTFLEQLKQLEREDLVGHYDRIQKLSRDYDLFVQSRLSSSDYEYMNRVLTEFNSRISVRTKHMLRVGKIW